MTPSADTDAVMSWSPCFNQVPGEMFALAMEAKKRDMGVVGSTQNILDFIAAKVKDAVERPFPDTLQVRGLLAWPAQNPEAFVLLAQLFTDMMQDLKWNHRPSLVV